MEWSLMVLMVPLLLWLLLFEEPAELSEAAEEGQMRKQKRVAATVAITRQSALEFIVVGFVSPLKENLK